MDRDIIFEDLTKPNDKYRLKEYLRELYRLIDIRFVSVDYSATPTIDADEGEIFLITLTGNITGLKIINPYQGRKVTIIFLQDGTGGRTVAWTTTVKLAGAAAIGGDQANEYSTITLVYTGSVWVEIARTSDVR